MVGHSTAVALSHMLSERPAVHVLEFGAGSGQRRGQLPMAATYLGLTTVRPRRQNDPTCGRVIIGDYMNTPCFPLGEADVALAADFRQWRGREDKIINRLIMAMKATGMAVLGWLTLSEDKLDIAALRRNFATVEIYEYREDFSVAVCTSPKRTR